VNADGVVTPRLRKADGLLRSRKWCEQCTRLPPRGKGAIGHRKPVCETFAVGGDAGATGGGNDLESRLAKQANPMGFRNSSDSVCSLGVALASVVQSAV